MRIPVNRDSERYCYKNNRISLSTRLAIIVEKLLPMKRNIILMNWRRWQSFSRLRNSVCILSEYSSLRRTNGEQICIADGLSRFPVDLRCNERVPRSLRCVLEVICAYSKYVILEAAKNTTTERNDYGSTKADVSLPQTETYHKRSRSSIHLEEV